MKRRLTLGKHFEAIIQELKEKNEEIKPLIEEHGCGDRIFTYLNEVVKEDAHNILHANRLVKDRFKKDLIEEVMSEMSEEEDYLNETINRKINKKITTHINNWLVKKLENNE